MSAPPPAAHSLAPLHPPRRNRSSGLLWLLAAVLTVCALLFIALTRQWPMVGDAALMHYSVFLMQHGWSPYRDFQDINMPGAYGAMALAMHLPGDIDLRWRLFDLSLIAAAGAGYYVIARPYSRFAALFATVLLLLVHGQDGVQQAGQRDLVIAVLLVLAVSCLLLAMRTQRWVYLVPFGLATGLAATIKPTAAPLGAALLLIAAVDHAGWWRSASAARPARDAPRALGWFASGMAAMLVAPAGMLLWLYRHHALAAWIASERGMLPYYATLDRRPFGFTLAHSLSPLLALVLLWLLCVLLRGPAWPRFERILIGVAILLNLGALLAQGKALPYQRYPMLVFLLLLIALDLTTAWQQHRSAPAARYAALAGLLCGCLVIAPLSLMKVRRFVAVRQQFDAMLESDLRTLHSGDLDRRVQCLDTLNDCLPTLDAMHIEPPTGLLSDTYLFSPARLPAVQAARASFLAEVSAKPPLAFVVVSGLFFDTASGYGKLDQWPAFQAWLDEHYTLAVTRQPVEPVRWWSRPQPPAGYRLYVLRPALQNSDH